jgi:2-polyprenyl-3-methyl-5-hydroxy-6-metoxy-1,4-benzoquinol methylase/spore coat polysaccharide biosynthesis predicted glycosyltransferase SpsG
VREDGFLLLPCVERGKGSGHIVRMLELRRALEEEGVRARLYLPESGKDVIPRSAIVDAFGIGPGECALEDYRPEEFPVAVADLFATGKNAFGEISRHKAIVGIDEGGPYRPRFDVLIDILPRARRGHEANIREGIEFMDLPPAEGRRAFPPRRVLVSFGSEDSAGLGTMAALALAEAFSDRDVRIDLIRGALNGEEAPLPRGVSVLGPIPGLRGKLGAYDLVMTHFGLTAYEAAASGCDVLLANPTVHHEALARNAGFPSLGAMPLIRWDMAPWAGDGARMRAMMEPLRERIGKRRGGGTKDLARFIIGASEAGFPGDTCPACASGGMRRSDVVFRDGERSYRECPECGTVALLRAAPRGMSYGADYFIEEYRKQYGRTYAEDMPKLRSLAALRLGVIEALAGGVSGKRVLDVGCAYGAFLLEARERGATCHGLDPSVDAVDRARESGIDARQGSFPEADVKALFREASFDVISLWYVIEHFRDLAAALAACRVLLAPGGLLALSTPNGEGISGRSARSAFLRASPADHETILSPESARRVLSKAGFRVARVRITGHHPERFPLPRGKGKAALALLGALSRLFRLGDTFEVYALREERR